MSNRELKQASHHRIQVYGETTSEIGAEKRVHRRYVEPLGADSAARLLSDGARSCAFHAAKQDGGDKMAVGIQITKEIARIGELAKNYY